MYGSPQGIQPMARLTGSDLLTHRASAQALGMGNHAIVRDAGYYTIRKDGTERLHFTAYYEALLEAKGEITRVTVNVAEITPMGVQPVWCDSFTTSSKSALSVARRVRRLTNLTGVRCKRTEVGGVVCLYPYGSDEMVAFNIPC